jgi:hypothetical protein
MSASSFALSNAGGAFTGDSTGVAIGTIVIADGGAEAEGAGCGVVGTTGAGGTWALLRTIVSFVLRSTTSASAEVVSAATVCNDVATMGITDGGGSVATPGSTTSGL